MKFLLLRTDNIGDLVCTTPLIEALRTAYPQATIDFLGTNYNIDILRHDPQCSQLWSYAKGKHEKRVGKKLKAYLAKSLLLLRLRREQYDAVILASPDFNKRLVAFARWINPKRIYGPTPKTSCKELPRSYQQVSIDYSAHHVLQVFTYAHALNITVKKPESVKLYLSPEEKEKALCLRQTILNKEQRPIIGLQLSARRPKQQWPITYWKQLIADLLSYSHVQLFWSPGSQDHLQHPGDDFLAQELLESFPKDSLRVDPTRNLRSLMTRFAACDLVVGADGGALHVAAGLGVSTLTLFGDVDPAIWAPYSSQGAFLKSPSDTLTDLSPEVVAERIKKLL